MTFLFKKTSQIKGWLSLVLVVAPILILLLLIYKSLNTLDSVSISQNSIAYDLRYKALVDGQNQLSPQQAYYELSEAEELEFNRFVAEFGDKSHWYLIDIRNTRSQAKQLVMLFDNPMLDSIDVFEVVEGRPEVVVTLGDSLAEIQDKKATALPSHQIQFAANERIIFLVKSKSLGAPQLPIALFEQSDFKRYQDALYMLWGGFVGIVMLMSIYNLILYLGTKEKIYVLYVGYILSFLAVLSVVHGFAIYLYPPSFFQFLVDNLIAIYFLLGCCLLLFTYYFLKFNQNPYPKIQKTVVGFSVVLLGGSVVSFIVEEYQAAAVFVPMQLFLYILALTMLLLTFKAKDRSSLYYLVSWIPLLVGSGIGTLLLTDGLAYGFWTRHAAYLGVMFEMAFISMALAERLRASQEETLYVATHSRRYRLPNLSLLETRIEELAKRQGENNSLLLVEVAKFEQVLPYLEQEQLIGLVNKFCNEIEQFFGTRLLISPIDKTHKIALVREGVFAMVIDSNDKALVKNTLSEFEHYLPLEIDVKGFSVSFKCYLGVCEFGAEKSLTVNQFINRAHQAIDIAQQQGTHFYLFDESAESEEGRKVQIASDLKQAITNNDLDLYHQPQVSLVTDRVLSSEVLLRWNHPKFGFISPEEFVAIAESTGTIGSLTEWVFERACQHLVVLQDKVDPEYTISVNVSAFDITQDRFLRYVIKMVKKYGISARHIMIELTETVLIDDEDKFDQNIKELKSLGFKIGMDDFGTGYSSLTYVSRHNFDELKIDKAFIQKLDSSESDHTIVVATLNMAKSLGIRVVAEGIETVQAEQILKQHNCEIGQGYYYSKPIELSAYLDWLKAKP